MANLMKDNDITITMKSEGGESITYKAPKGIMPNMGAAKQGIMGGLGRDTVPAMLTPGEHVINKPAAEKHRGILQAINNDGLRMAGILPMQYSYGGKVGYNKGGQVGPAWAVASGKLGFGPFAITVYKSEDGVWRRENKNPLPGYQQKEVKDIVNITPTADLAPEVTRDKFGGIENETIDKSNRATEVELSAPGVQGATVVAQKGTAQYAQLQGNANYVEQSHPENPHLSIFRLRESSAEAFRDQNVIAEDYASVTPEMRQQTADYEMYDKLYREDPAKFDALLKDSQPGSNIQKFAEQALDYSPFKISQGVKGHLNRDTGGGILGGIGNPGGEQRAAQGSNIVNPQGGSEVENLLSLGQAAQTVKDLGNQNVVTGTTEQGFEVIQINFSGVYGSAPTQDPSTLGIGSRATNSETGEVWEVR